MAGATRHRLSPRLTVGILLALSFLLSPLLVQSAAAIAPFLPWQNCRNSGNYTVNSTYQSNFLQLSATIPKKTSRSPDLFASGSIGTFPDTVYMLALCRGDANGSACESCVATAFQVAQELCPFDRDAAVFQELCYIRYSDLNFLATLDNGDPIIDIRSPENVSSPFNVFDNAVAVLLNATINHAVVNSSRRFATAVEDFDIKSIPSIYGLAQCTPDMSPADCRKCLDVLNSKILSLSGRQNRWLGGLRCHLRYAVYYLFYGAPMLQLQKPPAPVPAPTPSTPEAIPAGRTRNKTRLVLAINIPIIAAIFAINMVFLFLCWRRTVRGPASSSKLS